MNGKSRFLILLLLVGPTLICKPLQLITPDKLPSLPITIPPPETINSGWFAGAPGNWRKVVVFFDPIDGGQCLGLAFSRNPMQTIDAAGNVVFWANLDSNGTADRLVLGLTDGNLLIAARRGDPTPIGGTFGSMDAWPAD